MDAIFKISAIKQVARNLLKEGQKKTVWAFHASMGTGKTTLIHAICEELGVESAVSSPTFAIINEYRSPKIGPIYHMDWYRLKGEEEAIHAGVEEYLTGTQLCLVEWPENAPGILPDDCFHIYMESLDEDTRRLYTQLPEAG
ncbi:MAG: tRNA ((37)-N6)-threonylcarbamoyltransferase complex ATPase subunit type 1 TsaE [Bacteroidota bacterium]|jgi:tRNA threonylcarbamoyladenosine biosynthesis protein TsaE